MNLHLHLPVHNHDKVASDVVVRLMVHPGPDGRSSVVHLDPAQIPGVAQHLESIVLDYLHENTWGGEDARTQ